MWGEVGLFHTFEDFRHRRLKIDERGAVQLDLCGLSRTVEGTHPDASGRAVDDSLGELHARFGVLGGDGEVEVDDVGLNSLDSHNV